MKLNEKEALRYLGFRGKPADADTDEMIREIGGEMLRTLMPKCVYKRYDIKVLENAVELDGWRIESIKLHAIYAAARQRICLRRRWVCRPI